jgi:hypothetical protein
MIMMHGHTNLKLSLLVACDSHVVPAYLLSGVTHFKRIFCRLGISLLVTGKRTDHLHLQKAAVNIL